MTVYVAKAENSSSYMGLNLALVVPYSVKNANSDYII